VHGALYEIYFILFLLRFYAVALYAICKVVFMCSSRTIKGKLSVTVCGAPWRENVSSLSLGTYFL
jgi:hypothetical protein